MELSTVAARSELPGADPSGKTEQSPEMSRTALDYLQEQQRLEEDAREALPYAFDRCTQPIGALRQTLFSCLTCNPPTTPLDHQSKSAGICYSCSISCHGEHKLVELFHKRDFTCDCGTTRINSETPCNLRINASAGRKGDVRGEDPAEGNRYDHNFANRFCECNCEYDPYKEKGTMFQCLGLSSEKDGGCGEDWYHPSCIMGMGPTWQLSTTFSPPGPKSVIEPADGEEASKDDEQHPDTVNQAEEEEEEEEEEEDAPLPPGFPREDEFEYFICWKCVQANPWIKRYANVTGPLKPIYHDQAAEALRSTEDGSIQNTGSDNSSLTTLKRKREDDHDSDQDTKRTKPETMADGPTSGVTGSAAKPCTYDTLPECPTGSLSLFCTEGFRDSLCRCPRHFSQLASIPQLLEEEDIYQPPVSDSGVGDGASTAGSNSIYERGEAALAGVDRVKAIEGLMAFNKMKDGVMKHLKPYAESGKAVGAEDIKAIFAAMRGDMPMPGRTDDDMPSNDQRREQSGY